MKTFVYFCHVLPWDSATINFRHVIFRSDQGAKLFQPTIDMDENLVFAHVYAVFTIGTGTGTVR